MSKFLQLLLVTVVFLAGLQLTTSLAQQTSFATQNGDINGDGFIDMSDATRLLRFVLLGEEPPLPFYPKGNPIGPDPSPATEEILALIREHAETALASFPGLETINAEPDGELRDLTLTHRELLVSGLDADGWTAEHARAYITAFQGQEPLGRVIVNLPEDLVLSQLRCIKRQRQLRSARLLPDEGSGHRVPL